MTGCLPKCPEHLSGAPARLWADTVAAYDLEPHQLALLGAACDAQARMIHARDLVLEVGPIMLDGKGTPKAHPAVAIERDSRLAMARLLRELGLDVPVPDSRPPRRGGQSW